MDLSKRCLFRSGSYPHPRGVNTPMFVTYLPAMKICTPCHILNTPPPCAAKHPFTFTFLYDTLVPLSVNLPECSLFCNCCWWTFTMSVNLPEWVCSVACVNLSLNFVCSVVGEPARISSAVSELRERNLFRCPCTTTVVIYTIVSKSRSVDVFFLFSESNHFGK